MTDTLVLVSRTQWEEAPRLRHQIAESLSPYFKIIFVALPGRWIRHGLTRSARRRVREGFQVVALGNIALPPERLLAASAWLRRRLRRAWTSGVEQAVASLTSGRSVLLNFTHDLPGLMRSPVFTAAVYVCNDDWIGLARPGMRAEAARLEAETAQGAGLCLAVSYPLLERLQRINPRTRLLLPGHIFGNQVPQWRPPVPPFALCYAGFINDRLEREWLRALLREPDWDLRMVGKVERSFGDTRDLTATGRCRFLGELRGEALFRAMSAAHVLTFPYRRTAENMAITAPNKLPAYLAAGRPVVASALPHLLELPRHLLARAGSAAEFVAAAKEAVTQDCEAFFRERVRFAADQTWEKKARELKEEIEEIA